MNRDDRALTRRDLLRTAGTTGALGLLAGCNSRDDGTTSSQTSRATTTRPTSETAATTTEQGTDATTRTTEESTTRTEAVDRDRFETVVNVADAGADASGDEPVNPVLDEHVGDDTLLYFPPGRYRLQEWEVVDYSNLGVVGDDATLVPPDDERNYWLMLGKLRDFLLSGFTFDCRAPGVAPVTYLSVTGGTNAVRDVTLRGHRRAPRSGFEVAAADPSADLRFENVALPDGSTGGNGIYVFPESVGKLTFRNCRIEHWAEGLYASYHSGPIRVLGGYYANNGIDQVRVGGGHDGALVRGVTVRVDNPKQPQHKPNMRGIWMEEGGRVRIENCDVAVTDLTGTYSSGGIVVGRQFGTATVTNTTIRTDADTDAINVRRPIETMRGNTIPSMGHLPDDRRVTCRNVRISGTAGSGTAIRTTRRDDCLFEGVCIEHSRGSRDGVTVSDAEGCAVRDATIDVSGEPIATENAKVVTERLRTSGSC